MCRLGLALSLAFAAAGIAAPGLKDKPALYYPIRKGDTWVYETKGRKDGTSTEYVQVVTKVETKEGVVHVTLGMVEGGETALWAEVEVSQAGVVSRIAAGRKLDPPKAVIKLPFKPGEKWHYQPNPEGGGPVGKRTYTSVAEEEVEVPAGKYKAIRIDETWEDRGGPMRSSHWFAPGVGLVKQSTFEGSTETVDFVLKSFKPGK
jgi:hypothetical protein